MRRVALAATAAALFTVSACDLNIEPTNVTDTVTGREIRHPRVGAATASNYYLTVAGQEFQVYARTYDACPPGKQYPACKN